MRGGDCIKWSSGQELAKPGVTQPARGFFNGLSEFANARIGLGFGSSIDAFGVKWDFELGGQRSAKVEVGVSFGTAEAVMQVGGVQHQAEFPASLRERAQEGDGIGSSGQRHAEAHSRLETRGVEAERTHEGMIRPRERENSEEGQRDREAEEVGN